MTTDKRIVVGIFEDRASMRNALAELKQAQFPDEQLGFVLRDERGHHPKREEGRPHPVLRGLVGGLMGIADALLVPITGPTDATNILATTLPVAEDAIDHLPHGRSSSGGLVRPDAAMTASHAETAAEPSPEPVPTTEEVEEETEHQQQTSTITGEVVGGVLGAAVGILIPGIGPAIVVGSLASLFGVAFGGVAGGFLGTFVDLGVPEKKAKEYEKAVKTGKAVLTIHSGTRTQEAEEILRHNGASHVETH
jgi:hypothetical protein